MDSDARCDPRRAHPRRAVIDDVTEAVLEEATVSLTLLRCPMRLGDALAELHATASLAEQIEARLPVIVAAARDQDYGWDDIAEQLGVTAATAQARYRTPPTTTTR